MAKRPTLDSHLYIALDAELLATDQVQKLRAAFGQVTQTRNRQHAISEMLEADPPVTAVLIGVKEKLDSNVLTKLPDLRVIGSSSVGTDHIDLAVCRKRSIGVVFAEGVNAVSVAEHTLSLILAQAKRLLEGNSAVTAGSDRDGLAALPRELRGQNIGILGAGHTATALARLLVPFGTQVQVWTRNPAGHPEIPDLGGSFGSVSSLFNDCTVVTAHLPLHPETKGMISLKLLHSMRQDAIMVNVSRLELFEPGALTRIHSLRPDLRFAIDDFGLAAAGVVDALGESALFTPHVAGVTQEATRALIDHAVTEMIRVVKAS